MHSVWHMSKHRQCVWCAYDKENLSNGIMECIWTTSTDDQWYYINFYYIGYLHMVLYRHLYIYGFMSIYTSIHMVLYGII